MHCGVVLARGALFPATLAEVTRKLRDYALRMHRIPNKHQIHVLAMFCERTSTLEKGSTNYADLPGYVFGSDISVVLVGSLSLRTRTNAGSASRSGEVTACFERARKVRRSMYRLERYCRRRPLGYPRPNRQKIHESIG